MNTLMSVLPRKIRIQIHFHFNITIVGLFGDFGDKLSQTKTTQSKKAESLTDSFKLPLLFYFLFI